MVWLARVRASAEDRMCVMLARSTGGRGALVLQGESDDEKYAIMAKGLGGLCIRRRFLHVGLLAGPDQWRSGSPAD